MINLAWLGLIACGLAGAALAAGPVDEAKIRALQQRQAAAWNAHDIEAYASLFTPDADIVNVLGWHWRSRAELKEKLGRGFRSVFARSRMTIARVSVEFLKPDLAVAHVRWTMSGARSPTGAGKDVPQQGIQTQVLVKHGGVWRITHFQNTNSVPERAFPPPR
jgi:uncharacterized protein (TIGR02246 family)